jgi:hypothetical protein
MVVLFELSKIVIKDGVYSILFMLVYAVIHIVANKAFGFVVYS